MRAIAQTIFPAEGTGMPSIDEAEVVEYFDDMLAHLELKERFLIRALVALLEVQPLVFNPRRPTLFTKATHEERTKNLDSWENSSIFQRRIVFMAIRTMLLWAYVDSQEVERGMGFVSGTRRTAQRIAARKAEAEGLLAEVRGVSTTAAAETPKNGKHHLHDDSAPLPARSGSREGGSFESGRSSDASFKERA